jgi:virginiamycin B lyase
MTRRRPLTVLSLLVACLGSLAAGIAGAATPGEVTVFRLPSRCDYVAAAPEGVLTTCGAGSGATSVVNLLPSGEVVTRARLGTFEGPLLSGPGGEIWVGAGPLGWNGPHPRPAAIDRIAADGSVRRFPLRVGGGKSGRRPRFSGLVLGTEGAVWAALGEGLPGYLGGVVGSVGGKLVRIAADGSRTGFRLPQGTEPTALALGPDGNLWFTAVRGERASEHVATPGIGLIGRLTPAGQLSLFRIPGRGAEPDAIAAGPEGRLWFLQADSLAVATIGTDGSFGRPYPVHSDFPLGGIAFGPEGDAWIAAGDSIVRLTPAGAQTRVPAEAGRAITASGGDIWVSGDNAVTRLVPGAP